MNVGRLAASVLLLAGGVTACSSMEIRTDFDPAATPTISQYRTYSWLAHPRGGDTRVNNELVAGRIQRAVDAALAAKGYREVASGQGDFRVGYHAALEGGIDVTTVNSYYGYGRGRWRAGGVYVQDNYVREYDQGTLIIDVVDGRSNELVWRGSAQAEVKLDDDVQRREAQINEAAQKIFADFPPK